ncbi:MAG: hypothetical protein ACOYVK_07545 [Bacillota bacterium]
MKTISKLLLVVMIINLFSGIGFALESKPKAITVDGTAYTWESVTDKASHQKIKITNKETGSVEYVESKLVNDSYVHTVTTDSNQYTVEKVGEDIQIKDKNNKIRRLSKSEIDTLKSMTDGKTEEKSIEESSQVESQDMSVKSITIPNTPWSTVPNMTGYGSLANDLASASLLASLLATLLGGPVTGVLVAVASWYVSVSAPYVFYYVKTESRIYNGWVQQRKTYTYYKYHDYTGKLNTVTGPAINIHKAI